MQVASWTGSIGTGARLATDWGGVMSEENEAFLRRQLASRDAEIERLREDNARLSSLLDRVAVRLSRIEGFLDATEGKDVQA